MSGKSAVIFCASGEDIDPRYNEEACKVVRLLASKGYRIVSGGTTKGTMRVVADEAAAMGVENVGIVPRFMENLEHGSLTELTWTDTMSARKDLMRSYAPDLAIALPGGIGTMDELFETYTLRKLGKYPGRVVAYNCYGFYDGLRDMLDRFVAEGMLDARSRAMIDFVEDTAQLEKII